MADLNARMILTLIDRISGPAGRARQAVAGIATEARGLGSLRAISGAATRLGTGFSRVGQVGRGVLGNLFGIAADFEQKMTDVGAIMGEATPDQMAELQARARQLGATTRFTAAQVAEGMFFMAQAGQNADQILTGIGPTLSLAAAGMMDLGKTSDFVTDILAANGKGAAETQRLVDILANAAASATTDVTGLAMGWRMLGGVAANAGVTLEQQAAVLAVLADNGIKASKAGRNFRGVFGALSRMSGPAQDALRRLGIKRSELTDLSDVSAVAERFRKALAGASESKGREALFAIFGRENTPAIQALIKDVEKLRKITASNADAIANEKQIGRAAQIAQDRIDTTKGRVLTLKSAYEEFAIAIANLKMPREFLDQLTDFVRNVTQWVKENPRLAAGLVKVAIAGTVMATVFGPMLTLFGGLLRTVVDLRLAAVLLSGSMGGVGTAAGVATTAVGKLSGAMGALLGGFAAGTILDQALGISDKIADAAAGIDRREDTKRRPPTAFLGEMTAEERQRIQAAQSEIQANRNASAVSAARMEVESINQAAIARRAPEGKIVVEVNGPGRVTGVQAQGLELEALSGLQGAAGG